MTLSFKQETEKPAEVRFIEQIHPYVSAGFMTESCAYMFQSGMEAANWIR